MSPGPIYVSPNLQTHPGKNKMVLNSQIPEALRDLVTMGRSHSTEYLESIQLTSLERDREKGGLPKGMAPTQVILNPALSLLLLPNQPQRSV